MATTSITEPNVYHTDNTILSKCAWPGTISLPEANPVVTVTPVEDDESATIKEQQNKFNTPIGSVDLHHVSIEYSTIVVTSPAPNSKAILNVGGVRHEVLWRTLARLPNTRLGRLARLCKSSLNPLLHDELLHLCDDYDLSKEEFFFDCNPRSFTSIINFYRTGKLHLVDDICVLSFDDDLIYWGIDECYLEPCCQEKYHHKKEHVLEEIKKETEFFKVDEEDTFDGQYCSNTRRKLWDLVEHPHTSKAARIIVFISIAFIILSTFTMTISTIEGIGCTPNITGLEQIAATNVDAIRELSDEHHECREPLPLFIIEAVCVSWFTFEYIIRAYAAPNKCKFLKSILNTIDIISIVPFYISIILESLHTRHLDNIKPIRKTVQIFRVLRVMRILKLARHSTGLQALGYTLKRSYKELSVLLMFLAISILLFSSLAYFAEKDGNALQFRSIPHAFWWASITMTTVGYGDIYPQSFLGKIIGSICGVCGVLVIALPIPIIVNHFSEYYKEQSRREKALQRKETIERANKNQSFISYSNLPHTDIDTCRTSDEPLYNSACYQKKTSSSKQIPLTANQNVKQQDEDAKEALINHV